MFNKINILAFAFSAALLSAPAAHATTYIINYTGTDGSTAAFDVTASNTLEAVGGYDLLAITGGNVNGDRITGLVANPGQPNPVSNSAWQYDDVLFAGAPRFVDYYGFVATLASGGTANLFTNSTTDFELMASPAGGGYSLDSHGLATLSQAIPEPATWAVMTIGVFGVGAMLRRSRAARRNAAVA